MSTTTTEAPTLTAEYAEAHAAALSAFEPAHYLLNGEYDLGDVLINPGDGGFCLTERGVRIFRRAGKHLHDAAVELLDMLDNTTDDRARDLTEAAGRTAAIVAMAIEPLTDEGVWPGFEEPAHTGWLAYGIKNMVTDEYRRILEEE